MILHAKLPNDWNKYCDLKRTLQCLCRQSQNKSFLHYWTPTIKLQQVYGHLLSTSVKIKLELRLYIHQAKLIPKTKQRLYIKQSFSSVFAWENFSEYPHTEGEQVSNIPPSTIEVYGVKLLENLDPHIIYSSILINTIYCMKNNVDFNLRGHNYQMQ